MYECEAGEKPGLEQDEEGTGQAKLGDRGMEFAFSLM